MKTGTRSGYGIPIAVVVAGLLIAGAFFLGDGNAASSGSAASAPSGDFRVPNETDHMRGDPDASIAIIEFSDLECPFCARLHPTLARITAENDDIKWIYRHFPLTTIHSRALSAAVASECVARLAGSDAFWSFIDAAFADQGKLGDAWYRDMVASFGVGQEAFDSCVDDSYVVAEIQIDLDEAVGAGGRGTPYVVIVTPSGNLIPFSGALAYEQVKALVEQARVN